MATFKTRARTLDMLGRQQIAGIPTAINELFKNAHDAYADHVEVDFYRYDELFVLRDDGLGMTEKDFRQRWLTLGTESKVGSKGLEPPPKDPAKQVRPILGEKGIGRLAIAAIGPQVLVLSRAKRSDGLKDLVAAFIHWGLFECAGLDLDEIDIPLRTYPGGTLPGGNDIAEMVGQFRANTESLRERIGNEKADEILNDLDAFRIDPLKINRNPSQPSLLQDGCGTQFFIMPVSENLEMDIKGEKDQDGAPPLLKFLLGFTNTMVPDYAEPLITAAFRYHKSKDDITNLISKDAFFTPDEFKNSDHYFRGTFDEYGQFQGTVSIYGEEHKSHIIPWKESQGIPTMCGPFTIDLAVVMGVARESTLPFEDHATLIEKMNSIGGLYIYKDGIRILPYGDTNFDWLDIELRRSKSASYYFFSHRRMFGALNINSTDNRQLIEKAGREGFRENRAYRQFKAILRNFLIQLVADFFRDEGAYAEPFKKKKAELDRVERARRIREKTVTAKRSKLKESLDSFFEKCEAGEPSLEALQLSEIIEEKLHKAGAIDDSKEAAKAYMEVESMARQLLKELEETYRIVKPRGVGLGKKLSKDYDTYLATYAGLEESVFKPARLLIEQEVTEKAKAAKIELDRRIRIENALEELAGEAKKSAKSESSQTRAALERVSLEVKRTTSDSLAKIERILAEVFSLFSRQDVSAMPDGDLVDFRTSLENTIIEAKTSETRFLEHIRGQLESINFSQDITDSDVMEALEDRVINLEEQTEVDLQLAQLGMAIGIINHEFNGNVKSIRDNLKRLKAWADVNQNLREVYSNIRLSFDHLDGYLTLFTPLQRRMHRKAIAIRGSDIGKFLQDLFGQKFIRHSICLEATDSFKKKTIVEYPSSIYPVFVNLLDNAVFWLKDRAEPRIIKLDADDTAFIVSDNGPGIQGRDREDIFEMGFTRKPGGRGMGLFISREALRKTGYDLVLQNNSSVQGATFRIQARVDSVDLEKD